MALAFKGIKVFLDANVLYQNVVRSLFIWLHVNQVAHVYWSQKVWDEVFTAFTKNQGEERAKKFISSMTNKVLKNYTECMVTSCAGADFKLRDPKDNHVVQAAQTVRVHFLLTFNQELISDCAHRFTFQTMNPDSFLVKELTQRTPWLVKQSVIDHFNSLTTSKPSRNEYLNSLHRAGLREFSKIAKNLIE
jgi:predicted nucleic acid-binding protein